jgi:uncharacterized protein YabE (DUF348 family)
VRKSAKFCLYAVVLAGVVGGTAAWATTEKSVKVSIDGQIRTIHTRAATVGDVLSGDHIVVGAHDALAPADNAGIYDGSQIVIKRGRLLELDIDGTNKDVWTTATTVDQALSQLGYGTGKTVSVSRSTRLPLTPTSIELLTPKKVTVRADGKTRTILTTNQTVAGAIAGAGFILNPDDQVSVPVASRLFKNEIITITRVVYVNATKRVAVPYTTSSTPDPTMPKGTTQVITAGQAGLKLVTYQYVYINGRMAGQVVINTTIIVPAVDQVQKSGTEAIPAGGPTPVGAAQTIARLMVAARGWDGTQFGCLVNLWDRESGWNTHAANPSGAYGIPQALPGSKMSSAGPDWQDNASTQISWGLGYIAGGYGNPCGAWAHSNATGWY